MRVSIPADPPALTDWQALAVRAFGDLMGERAISSEVMGPIYWRAIAAWCDRYGVRDAEPFIELVQQIDRDYLSADSPTASNKSRTAHAKGFTRH